jgi:hypothetical protein
MLKLGPSDLDKVTCCDEFSDGRFEGTVLE